MRARSWDVRFQFLSPDGVEKMIATVNEEYHSPEIRVNKGDMVSVAVTNDLSNTGLTIHWHGITGNGWYDGVAHGTQCPIGGKETFTYEFEAHQHGTYFWHAHTATLRAPSLTGALIIEDPDEPFTYDDEFTLLLSDHWNLKDDRLLVEGLRQQAFKWVGDPQDIMINGQACAAGAWSSDECAALEPAVFNVTAGMTYRLRLINAAAMSFLNFAVEGHSFTVVEIDGHYVEPYTSTSIELNTGNRVSVLMTADQDVANYWATASTRFRDNLRTGSAVFRYAGADEALPTTDVPAQSEPVALAYSDATYIGAGEVLVAAQNAIVAHADEVSTDPCPSYYDRLFVVVNSQERMDRAGLTSYTSYTFEEGGAEAWASSSNVDPDYADTYGWYDYKEVDGLDSSSGYLKWPVHVTVDADDLPDPTGTAADYGATPIQLGLYYGVEHDYPAVYDLELDDVVDVVIQNSRALNGKLEQHPWHLHGHSFWVLASGTGIWDATYRDDFNTVNPPKQDVVSVYPGAWAVVRFVANEPGAFGFHCHIAWHVAMGNQIYFYTDKANIPAPPVDFPICGDVTTSVVAAKLASLDSSSWHKKDQTSKDCAWVSRYSPKRCSVKGEDRVLAMDACMTTCA